MDARGDFVEQRSRMVRRDLAGRDVTDARVLQAMGAVPRERFVPVGEQRFAYADRALPIGHGQTISQPYVVAVMLQALELGPDDELLEVGAGSGYAVAVASLLCRRAIGIERVVPLAEEASARLTELGYTNATVVAGDGTAGTVAAPPVDAILVSAAGPEVPPVLVDALRPGGRLVMPVGARRDGQQLVRLRRPASGPMVEEDLGGVAFVPLIGEQGWPD